ncbi:MAG: HK97 family phage prohead protease, partial [Actinomycetia bacterium]|nr:HK97 family phage prohead protease [Actinomycetes bacterium]
RSANLGGFVEQVSPAAFTKTILEADVRALRDHNPSLLLGRTGAGTLRMSADDHGLAYEIDLPDTTEGRDTAELLRRRDLTGSSFGFRTISDEWTETGDGYPLRILHEAALRDVGPVTFPAYPDSGAALRSLATARHLDLEELVAAAGRDELRTILSSTAERQAAAQAPVVRRRNWRAR